MEHLEAKSDAIGRRSETRILQLLREQGESSAAELARMSGLGKATVSRAIASLRQQGMIEETGADFRTLSAGRSGKALRLNPNIGLYLGVAIGPGVFSAVLADAAKQVKEFVRTPIDRDTGPEAQVEALFGFIGDVIERNAGSTANLLGIGLAISAPFSRKTGFIGLPALELVPAWFTFDIVDRLSERFGLPVFVDNDSNCSALAEVLWSNLPREATIAYVKLDQGVGGALIVDGQVRRGLNGQAGEYGHMSYDRNGSYCRCGGRGCFEHYLSIPSLLHRVEPVYGEIDFDTLVEKFTAGDRMLQLAIEETGNIAGELLSTIANVADPDLFVLGGEMMLLGQDFLDIIEKRFKARNPFCAPIRLGTAVKLLDGAKQQYEPALGAVGLVLQGLKSGGTDWAP